MSDSLLRSDILAFLQAHAQGHARAVPRHRLMSYLKANGHSVTDRAMRRAYADIDSLGSCAKGLFWIVTAEDRRVAGKQLHGRAMSELVREKRIRDAGACGQINLFEEA